MGFAGIAKLDRAHDLESCGTPNNFSMLPGVGDLRHPARKAFGARFHLRKRRPTY